MKTCSKCKLTKSLDSFYLHPGCKGGVNTMCKSCHGERTRRRQKENPEICAASSRRWRATHPEKSAEATRRWYRANKNQAVAYQARRSKIRYASDPNFRLLKICRGRIRDALCGKSKSQKTIELVGCSIAYLNTWLELQFQPGMSWDNYGQWHIDHIRPCASFDLSDPANQRACFHYTNLQPLWATDNHRKGAKWKSQTTH